MSKTILASVDGFTPLIDVIVQEHGVITAAVFGKAWRYCQMSDGVCRAGQERIAAELGISRQTVNTHLAILCEYGYLKDKTPDLVGVPHTYADTGKANLSIKLTTSSPQPVKEIDTTCQKDLHPHPQPVKEFDTTCQRNVQPPVKEFDTKKVLKKELKKLKKETKEKPDFSILTVSQAMAIPELQAFRDATGWFPGSFVWETVYDAMQSIEPENLRAAFKEWTARGYKAANVQGYLEWAKNGIPPARKSGADKGQATTAPQKRNLERPSLMCDKGLYYFKQAEVAPDNDFERLWNLFREHSSECRLCGGASSHTNAGSAISKLVSSMAVRQA